MDYAEKIQQVDQLTFDGHHAQSIITAASLLEEMLRHLVQQVQSRLSPADQQVIAEKLAKIGQGKPIADLTLGQIVGLYREAQLSDKLEKHLGRKLPRLRSADFNGLLEIRNKAAHHATDVHEDDARWAAAQLRVWVREAGFLDAPPSTPHAPRSTLHHCHPGRGAFAYTLTSNRAIRASPRTRSTWAG